MDEVDSTDGLINFGRKGKKKNYMSELDAESLARAALGDEAEPVEEMEFAGSRVSSTLEGRGEAANGSTELQGIALS